MALQLVHLHERTYVRVYDRSLITCIHACMQVTQRLLALLDIKGVEVDEVVRTVEGRRFINYVDR
jgi:hypothetical protein